MMSINIHTNWYSIQLSTHPGTRSRWVTRRSMTEDWSWDVNTDTSYPWGMVLLNISSMHWHTLSQFSGLNLVPLEMTMCSRQLVPDLASCSLSVNCDKINAQVTVTLSICIWTKRSKWSNLLQSDYRAFCSSSHCDTVCYVWAWQWRVLGCIHAKFCHTYNCVHLWKFGSRWQLQNQDLILSVPRYPAQTITYKWSYPMAMSEENCCMGLREQYKISEHTEG